MVLYFESIDDGERVSDGCQSAHGEELQFSSYTSATVEFIRPSFSTGAILIVALLFPSFCAADDLIGELEADLGAGRLARMRPPRRRARCAASGELPRRPHSFLGLNDRDGAEPLLQARRRPPTFIRPPARRKSPGSSFLSGHRRVPATRPRAGRARTASPRPPCSSPSTAVPPGSIPSLAAAPGFVRIGRSVFGADPPFTRLFLFSDNAAFEKFYRVVFGPQRPHGTGGPGIAVMTEKNARDRPGRMPPWRWSCTSLTHAWIQGYGRDVGGSRINYPAVGGRGHGRLRRCHVGHPACSSSRRGGARAGDRQAPPAAGLRASAEEPRPSIARRIRFSWTTGSPSCSSSVSSARRRRRPSSPESSRRLRDRVGRRGGLAATSPLARARARSIPLCAPSSLWKKPSPK